ncbi:DUF4153 domain-containing protein [Dyadobacter psychrotolerans]|uniref:DUF4173 domain-containing protein n=1 Tax=Dyadobacter psychrotolerans TaxID=2541721 RepID=A0A4V2Z4L3_9BACT|nr:DUF4173 domain-containing protein [Dyadobacter psychrotolerans]TDE16768.1 DUF4173 domain-containing protein [Dyadobacter psychrotolerans]
MSTYRTCILWFFLVILHTWLFFEYDLGLNGFIFSSVTIGLITWFHKLHKEKNWLLGAGAHLVIAFAVFWHGSDEATAMYHFSFFLLAGFVFSIPSGLPVTFLNGLIASLGGGFIAKLANFIKEDYSNSVFLPKSAFKKAYLYVAPITVTLLFYLFYSAANPDFWLNIALPDFELNLGWLLYTFVGFVLLCPLFFPWGLTTFTAWETSLPNELKRIRSKPLNSDKLGLKNENKQGVIMFAMLNTLILLFLSFNILQIFIPSLSTANRNHSEQVHQGFETLVMSIIIAILLIMFYFRGNQNFYDKRTRLVQLATVWIFLNGLLALFTCYKNILYVEDFGLTYKRIWVFIGMLLTGIGLVLTLKKIKYLKTNLYLIRQNSWVLYFVLTSYVVVDWDRLITWYNPNFAQELDMNYIISLGRSKTPYLNELVKKNDPRVEAYKDKIQTMTLSVNYGAGSWRSATIDRWWLVEELAK